MENRKVHVPMILKEETDNTFSGEESDSTFPEDPTINDGRKRHLPIQEFIFEDNKDNISLQILEKNNSETQEDVRTNINKELGQIRKMHLPIILKSEDDTVESTDSNIDKNLPTQEYYFIKEEQINETETSLEHLVQKNSTCNIKEPLLGSNCSSSKKDLFQSLEPNVEIKKEDAVEITLQDITETNQNFQIFLNNIPNHENKALRDTNSLTNNCSAKTTNDNKNTEQNIPPPKLTYINNKNTESQEEKLKIDKDPKPYVYNKNTVIEEEKEKEKKENLLETDIKIDKEKVDEILHTSVDIKEQEPQDFPQESEIFDLTKDDNNEILQTVNHSTISTQLTQKSNITQPLNIQRLSKVIENSLFTTKEGDISTTETVDLTEDISENTNSRLPTELVNSITKTIEGIIQSNDDILGGAHKVRKKAVKHPSTSKKCKNVKPISTQYLWTPKGFVPINPDSQELALNLPKQTTITNKATNINENLITMQKNEIEKNKLMDVSDTIDLTEPKKSSIPPNALSNIKLNSSINDHKRTAKNGAENKIQNVSEIVLNYVPKNTITVQPPQNTLVANNVEDNTIRPITRNGVAKNNTKIPKEVPSPKNKTLTENCQLNATRSPKRKLFFTPSGSVYEIGPNICKRIKLDSQKSITNIIKETEITNETAHINQNSELSKILAQINTSEGPKNLIENDVIDLTEASQSINDNTSAVDQVISKNQVLKSSTVVPRELLSPKNKISSENVQLNSTKSLKRKLFYTPNGSSYEIGSNVCKKNKLDSQKLITDFIKKKEVATKSKVNQNLVSIQKNQMVKNKEIGGDSKRNTHISNMAALVNTMGSPNNLIENNHAIDLTANQIIINNTTSVDQTISRNQMLKSGIGVSKEVTSSKKINLIENVQITSTTSQQGRIFFTPNGSVYEIERNVSKKIDLDPHKSIKDLTKKTEVINKTNSQRNAISTQKSKIVVSRDIKNNKQLSRMLALVNTIGAPKNLLENADVIDLTEASQCINDNTTTIDQTISKNQILESGTVNETPIVSGNEKLSLQTIPNSPTSIVINHASQDTITVPQAFPNGFILQNNLVVNNVVTINTTSNANENSILNTGANEILTQIVQPILSNTQNNLPKVFMLPKEWFVGIVPQNELDTYIKYQIDKNVILPLKSNIALNQYNNNASCLKPPTVLSNQPVEIFEITENIPGTSLKHFQAGTSSVGQSSQDTLNCLSNSEKIKEIEANNSQKISLHENEPVILEMGEKVPFVTDGNPMEIRNTNVDTLETSLNVQQSKMKEFRSFKHVKKSKIKLKQGEEFKVNDIIYVKIKNGYEKKKFKKKPPTLKKLKKVDFKIVDEYRKEINAKNEAILTEKKKKKLMEIISLSCDKCDFKTLEGKKDLILHSVVHRPKAKLYECSLCPFKGTCQSYFKKHMNSHSAENKENVKKMKCEKCSYSTGDTSNLNKHKRIHMTDKEKQALPDLKCDLCDYVCKFQDLLRAHMKQVHKKLGGIKTHKCEECLYFTTSKKMFEAHMVDVHGKELPDAELLSCDKCFFSTHFKFQLRRHKQTHNKKNRKEKPQDEPMKCHHCSHSTLFKQRLIEHLKTHAEKIYKCIYCEFKTGRSTTLKSHLLRHKDKDSSVGLQCNHCEYKTTIKQELGQHIQRMHQRKQK